MVGQRRPWRGRRVRQSTAKSVPVAPVEVDRVVGDAGLAAAAPRARARSRRGGGGTRPSARDGAASAKAYFCMVISRRPGQPAPDDPGSAMTTMSSRPMKIDMTMPGTLSSPKPNVTSHDEGGEDDAGDRAGAAEDGDAAEHDHGHDLELPAEGDRGPGRAEPRGQAAPRRRPDIRPVRQNSTNFTRATRMPEKSAAIGLLPMAIDALRPKLVRCRRKPKTTASDQEEHELEGEHPPDIALAEEGEARAGSRCRPGRRG